MDKRTNYVHAWAVWTVSAVFFFYKYVIEISPSVMAKDLMASFHIGGAELGNLASSYYYSYFLMQLPVGLLLDRFGPRRITTLAIALCGIGIYFFSHSETFASAMIARFIIGIGAAFGAINIFKLCANWFPEKWFAFMAGLSMTVAMLGAIGGEGPLAAFIHLFDWRISLFYIGVSGVILAVIFYTTVRDYPRDHIDLIHSRKKTKFLTGLLQILKNPYNWIIAIYSGLAFAPITVFGGLWGVSFIEEAYGFSKENAANSISLLFVGFAIGAPFFGWLSNKLGRRKPLMLSGTFIATLLSVAILFLIHMPFYCLFALIFLFGFFLSCFFISFTVIHEYNIPLVTATAVAIMNAFNAFFCAISNPLIGKILDMGWDGTMQNGARIFSIGDYQKSLFTIPLYLGIALILVFFSKETFCKQKK